MSEYAEIVVGKLSLCSFRNYLDGEIVSLFFSKKDLVVIHDYIDDDNEDAGTYTKYTYKTTVQYAKERLDACGFGLNNLKKVFNDNMLQVVDYSGFLQYMNVDYDEYDKKAEMRIKKNVTFKKWQNAMKKIVRYEVAYGNIESGGTISDVGITTECDKVIFYSLKDRYSKSFYALNPEIIHFAFVYRLILENCEDDAEVVLDFSNLAFWADDCIPMALEAAGNIEKTIVLVEGTSDKDILEFSMSYLYPHLSDLFYFMDFDDENGGKRDGGTSFVIKNLKNFLLFKNKIKFYRCF